MRRPGALSGGRAPVRPPASRRQYQEGKNQDVAYPQERRRKQQLSGSLFVRHEPGDQQREGHHHGYGDDSRGRVAERAC